MSPIKKDQKKQIMKKTNYLNQMKAKKTKSEIKILVIKKTNKQNLLQQKIIRTTINLNLYAKFASILWSKIMNSKI